LGWDGLGRKPKTENRKPKTENRKPKTESGQPERRGRKGYAEDAKEQPNFLKIQAIKFFRSLLSVRVVNNFGIPFAHFA
jgi:hypothetical protein